MIDKLKAEFRAFFDEQRANVEWDDDKYVLVDAQFDLDALIRRLVAAMREPTPDMEDFGDAAIESAVSPASYEPQDGLDAPGAGRRAWQTMIDAALTGEKWWKHEKGAGA